MRHELAPEYETLEQMLEKLEYGHVHIAVFGRVGVGKSSVLNALLGEQHFYTSALHGATTTAERGKWVSLDDGHVVLYDTPGINEIDGEERARLAHEVAATSDLVLFVVEGDITESEISALRALMEENQAIVLVLNKTDRYTTQELELLMETVRSHVDGLISAENIVAASAWPAERIYVEVDEAGNENEVRRRPAPRIEGLRDRLWEILESEGKTLSAVNAGMFAGRVSDRVTGRIMEVRQELAQRTINNYCLAKGLSVAFNPIPISDLVAAAALDVALVLHLSRIYGLPLTRSEATGLITVIITQLAALMGAVWAMNLVSSVLKVSSVGFSTLLTASAQGAVAYYATLVVGRSAELYLKNGKSWGEGGSKRAVKRILKGIDRNSVLAEARATLQARLKFSD